MNKLEELSKEVEEDLEKEFEEMCKNVQKNSMKVIKAFQECNLQEMHLNHQQDME